MPSKSKAQRNLMAAAAHNPAFAKKVGIPVDVAQEFNKADKGRKFGSGGMAKKNTLNNPKVNHGSAKYFKEGGSMATKKLFGGKETYSEEKKEAQALKSGKISTKQYIRGEKSEGHKEENLTKTAKAIKSGKMSPTTYAKSEKAEKYARGGGVEVRGKTKGKIVTMKKGGKC